MGGGGNAGEGIPTTSDDALGKMDGARQQPQESYGLDVSLPIQRAVSTNYQPLGDRRAVYLKHLQGCRNAYPHQPESCDHYEYHRMLMNLRQPVSMKK